jgi:5-methyltetrahydrofolate--homocysteine methyltransferase
LRTAFVAANHADYAEIRERHKDRGPGKRLVPLAQARAQKFDGGWADYAPPVPRAPGLTVFDDFPLQELIGHIDWSPFFNTWELAGRYPAILEDAVVGAQARELYADARAMLERIVAEKWLTAKGVVGLWPARGVGDDIEVLAVGAATSRLAVLHCLRQQADKPLDRPDFCLADFVSPHGNDWVGAFAVTAGLGCDERVRAFEAQHDDYNAILLKALADRLAEAFAEVLHAKVRRELWGYADDETLDNDALIREEYRGIRPAPGYPACPDHTEKATIFRLLQATRYTGMELTESFAMTPAAAVSGLYFSHPKSQYFVVGRVTREQVEDYAARKGWGLAEAERWLAPNLDYDPD